MTISGESRSPSDPDETWPRWLFLFVGATLGLLVPFFLLAQFVEVARGEHFAGALLLGPFSGLFLGELYFRHSSNAGPRPGLAAWVVAGLIPGFIAVLFFGAPVWIPLVTAGAGLFLFWWYVRRLWGTYP